MKKVFLISRAFVPLWLCLGTHLHIVLEYAAEQDHALQHATEARHEFAIPRFDSPQPIRECALAPFHHHTDDVAPHSHQIDAVRSLSQSRDIQSDSYALPWAPAVETSASGSSVASSDLPNYLLDSPSLRFRAPRAPPAA